MAMRMESYMALLAVMFAFIMVQMQITVDGAPNATTINYNPNSTVTGTTVGTRVTTTGTGGGGTGGGTGVTGGTGGGTGGTGGGTGGTGGGTGGGATGTGGNTNALYSTSSSKTGCFQMLQHVLMALSFLQIIQ